MSNVATKLKRKVIDWYRKAYPTDNAWLNDSFTFTDLLVMLGKGDDVYIVIDDSLVRERCFEELADIMGTDYDFVYTLWLNGMEKAG